MVAVGTKRKNSTPSSSLLDAEAAPSKRRSTRNLKSKYFEVEDSDNDGVDNDDDDDDGGDAYEDGDSAASSPGGGGSGGGKLPRIKKATLDFLEELAANNDREWFQENNKEFKDANENFKSFVEVLSEKVIEKDSTIPELPLKDLLFRIYRDMRFSNDKTPYKCYLSAAWSRTGRKGPYAHYYLSIQPGSSFIGGGIWHGDAQPLSLMRRDIDSNPHRIRRVLGNKDLFDNFYQEKPDTTQPKGKKGRASTGSSTPKDTKDRVDKMIRWFCTRNSDDALKTSPKGYDKDHKDIDLLRLKSFTLGKRLTDEEVLGSNAIERIADLVGAMAPFINYLNDIVMPDLNAPTYNANDDSDDEDEGDEEDEEDEEES